MMGSDRKTLCSAAKKGNVLEVEQESPEAICRAQLQLSERGRNHGLRQRES